MVGYILKKGNKHMAEVIAIDGGYKLNGTVRISGAKNATVALDSRSRII